MRISLACAESHIDALQRKSPTVGRKPFERGGRLNAVRDRRDERDTRNRGLHVAPVALGVPVSRLFGRCFSTRCTGILGSLRKRNFAEDGISVPGHKPIQQISEGLYQWKVQEN